MPGYQAGPAREDRICHVIASTYDYTGLTGVLQVDDAS